MGMAYDACLTVRTVPDKQSRDSIRSVPLLVVKGLPTGPDIDQQSLADSFRWWGPIYSVRHFAATDQQPSYAVVQYLEEAAAREASSQVMFFH